MPLDIGKMLSLVSLGLLIYSGVVGMWLNFCCDWRVILKSRS